jgi:two-component system, NarL family, nitrate/nitrite response regulator NarL
MQRLVKILLIDNLEVLTDALRRFLYSDDDLAVLGVTDSGVRVVRGGRDETLVLDLESSAGGAMAEMGAASLDSRVLALSAANHTDTILRAEALNAGTCVLADTSGKRVADAIDELLEEHDILVSYTPSAPAFQRDPAIDLLVSRLSPREREVLELVTVGYSNQRIAETYFLSLHTVRTHIQSILIKLGVHSKLEAAIFAVQHRLVAFGGEAAETLLPRRQPVQTG